MPIFSSPDPLRGLGTRLTCQSYDSPGNLNRDSTKGHFMLTLVWSLYEGRWSEVLSLQKSTAATGQPQDL